MSINTYSVSRFIEAIITTRTKVISNVVTDHAHISVLITLTNLTT